MNPPVFADWALRFLVRPGVSEDVIGDLHEEYSRYKLPELGAAGARIWYWRQAWGVLFRYGWLRLPGKREPALLPNDPLGGLSAWWNGLWLDLRSSVRGLVRASRFSVTAILILALGIGAASTVFSAVYGVLLRPLPYDRPEELLVVGGQLPGIETQAFAASGSEFLDYQAQAKSFRDLAASWPTGVNLTGGERPVRVESAGITSNLFSLLGVSPALGRDFTESDAGGNIGYVAILSHEAWQTHFGGAPDVIGRPVKLDGDPMTIIGVMPRGFKNPGESDARPVEVWVTVDISEGSRFDIREGRGFTLIGRLQEGVSLEESQAELDGIADGQRKAHPGYYPSGAGWTVRAVPLLEHGVERARGPLLVLFGAVALVLLVVTVNLASLHLTRGATQLKDYSLRAAVGGSRPRITRQLLIESLLLGLAGGLIGVFLAVVGTDILRGLVSSQFPRFLNIEVSGTVVVFAGVVSLGSVLLFGLLPAIQISGTAARQVHGRFRTTSGPTPSILRDGFVAVQVSLSLVLLVSAGLLLKSFDRMRQADPGFDEERVLTLGAWLPFPNDTTEGKYFEMGTRIGLYEQALSEMLALPGVSQAGVTSFLPLQSQFGSPVFVEGEVWDPGAELPTADFRVVSESYFATMGIALQRGRLFSTDGDGAVGPPLEVIVNEALAERKVPDEDPLGKRIRPGGPSGPWWEIIGVVENVRHPGLETRPREAIYTDFRQWAPSNMTFVLKTEGPPEDLTQPATEALQRADPDLPASSITSMEELVATALAPRRTLVLLLALFSLQALVLAAIGIYGVVSFAVTQRVQEIGIRLSIGGARLGILRMLWIQGIRLGLLGAVVGFPAAVGVTRTFRAYFFEIPSLDPYVYSAAAALALVVASIASLIPALRATRVDPCVSIKVV